MDGEFINLRYNERVEPPKVTPEENKEAAPSYFKAVRTFEDDVATLLKAGGSLAASKIAEIKAAEAKKTTEELSKQYAIRTMVVDDNSATQSTTGEMIEIGEKSTWLKTTLYVLLAIILLGGGGFAIFKLFMYIQEKTAYVPEINTNIKQSPLIADSQQVFDIGSANRARVLEEMKKLNQGFQELVLYTKDTAGVARFARFSEVRNILNLTMPANLERLISNYMIGVISIDGVQHGYMAISADVFEGAFSGMSRWELTMPQDLSSLVSVGAETSTSLVVKDVLVKNRDTRVFVDSSNKEKLVWGFMNKNVIVITDNTKTFEVLLDRYLNGSLVR